MTWTSAEAYDAAVASGLVSKRRLDVLTDLYKNGPSTAREIFERTGRFAGGITPRLVELEVQELVRREGAKRDGPLNTWCVVWSFNPVPAKPYKRIAGKQSAACIAYAAALRTIAGTACDCGGPEMPLFRAHIPGCASQTPNVKLAREVLDAHPVTT
jgi:hypothetical protein